MKAKYRIRATPGKYLAYTLEKRVLGCFWKSIKDSDYKGSLEQYIKDIHQAGLYDSAGNKL